MGDDNDQVLGSETMDELFSNLETSYSACPRPNETTSPLLYRLSFYTLCGTIT